MDQTTTSPLHKTDSGQVEVKHLDFKPNEPLSAVWGRWLVTIIAVVVANVATVSYMSGNYSRQIEDNTTKIINLEQAIREAPTRNEWTDIKADLKEIKIDIKELNRRK